MTLLMTLLGKSMKILIPVLLMLVCGCRMVTESSGNAVISDEKVSAIVAAYKAAWHSFYDEGNFEEMFVVGGDYDESGCSRSFSYDCQTSRIQDRIRLYVDEFAYSNWNARVKQILDRAHGDSVWRDFYHHS